MKVLTQNQKFFVSISPGYRIKIPQGWFLVQKVCERVCARTFCTKIKWNFDVVILSIEKAFDALQTRLNDSSTDEIEMLEVIQVRTHTITINRCSMTHTVWVILYDCTSWCPTRCNDPWNSCNCSWSKENDCIFSSCSRVNFQTPLFLKRFWIEFE